MGSISLDRCLCVHSMSQIVDIVIQSLLFQRGIIQEPIQQLRRLEPNNRNLLKYQSVSLFTQKKIWDFEVILDFSDL